MATLVARVEVRTGAAVAIVRLLRVLAPIVVPFVGRERYLRFGTALALRFVAVRVLGPQ